ncbi:MAG: prephenate dehydrogenase/arogenate dehydrogenase family protein, partial [Bacteroidetes bacterium]
MPINITVVGIGLISGSFALRLKNLGWAARVVGVCRSAATAERALQLGLV